jgi:hypothetical protein
MFTVLSSPATGDSFATSTELRLEPGPFVDQADAEAYVDGATAAGTYLVLDLEKRKIAAAFERELTTSKLT